MKKILITGKNSFVGNSLEKYLTEKFPEKYEITKISLKDGSWNESDFGGFDAVFHVAGIAHSDNGKIPAEKEQLYRSVNTELTIETAKKAKADGAKQFIFMSSAIVYGDSAPIGKIKHITKDTSPVPANCYGDSKLQAEYGIKMLEDENFRISVIRPPMIYGKGSKGNFPILEKFGRKLPIFPEVNNSRSMLYIDNLCEFVRLLIENEESGIFFPQNKEYSNTCLLVQMIGKANGNKVRLVPGFTWALKFMGNFTGLVDKAFGNMTYDQSMSEYKENYRLYSLEESIAATEGKKFSENF